MKLKLTKNHYNCFSSLVISQMKIRYDCIGVDLDPSTFVLRLQTVPVSFPLVYVISWMDYPDYPEDSLWVHRVIAVANVAPPDSEWASLHVIFQPARRQIAFYHITLVAEPAHSEVQAKLIQASQLSDKTIFENVRPGKYKVKVEISDYICESDPLKCPPLFSHNITVENTGPEPVVTTPGWNETIGPTNASTHAGLSSSSSPEASDNQVSSGSILDRSTIVASLSTLVVLTAAAFVMTFLCVCAKRHREGRLCCKLFVAQPKKVIIDVTSLADRSLEQKISRYFAEFLTEALGAEVNLTLPYMSQSSSSGAEVCTTPTGSDDPLLQRPIWTTRGDGEKSAQDTTMFCLILDFFYGSHVGDDFGPSWNAPSVQGNNACATKNWHRLSSELRQAIAFSNRERILCVTFAHQEARNYAPSLNSAQYEQNDAMSSWTEGSKSRAIYSDYIPSSVVPRCVDDNGSLMNRLNPESSQTEIFGVAQFFLPADRHQLYSRLVCHIKGSRSHQALLDSEHSESLIKALEVYKKAREQRLYSENGDGSLSRSSSVKTLDVFIGVTEELDQVQ
ncbi:hypothetical protein ElyMa_001312800 [Elysia marginata]|uniref:SEFIR domain-containing protein n=1 Tax=Elysia marginata TaxID=1093978 RepID=A0AAV4INC5_9GAST|nr:hypothetical protein ElyMa_001312800 [Elysia marginata]